MSEHSDFSECYRNPQFQKLPQNAQKTAEIRQFPPIFGPRWQKTADFSHFLPPILRPMARKRRKSAVFSDHSGKKNHNGIHGSEKCLAKSSKGPTLLFRIGF
jgi:hypothetical protein